MGTSTTRTPTELGTSPRPQPRRRFPAGDRAVYDLLILRRKTIGDPAELTSARERVDKAKGTTDIVELRQAALLEARAALAIVECLPPADLIDEDDLEDTAA